MLPRALVLGLAALLLTACRFPRTDSFFVEGAALAERQVALPAEKPLATYEQERAADFFATRGHRLVADHNVVLAYRRFSPGNWFVIDDEVFEKLTIEVPESLVKEGAKLAVGPDQPVTLRYSEGGSAWPGMVCYGEATTGSIAIEQVGPRLVVSLTAHVVPSSRQGPCDATVLERRLTLKPRELASLTPWLGSVGRHPYAETHP